ncbi:hypothetical protein CWATWH8502_879 [Crocosphaera watsonii WH 8502]|uniref:Uncharacterized protein n=1 Tax=Crocosphaera watsonii WH 8502 TaxID=423474 RepID=T2IIB5_CROWT|nr:hypothetical protein CWATWH8502_879 [Crocosphaera watsonii WH 8502]
MGKLQSFAQTFPLTLTSPMPPLCSFPVNYKTGTELVK